MKVLMVCLGNICRSPMAEGILRKKAREHGLDWEIDSAGTYGGHSGEPPHIKAIAVAKSHNVDISMLKSRQIKRGDLIRFDRIFVMDAQNYKEVLKLGNPAINGIVEKLDYLLNQSRVGENLSVPDPWYANTMEAFENTYQLLAEACDGFIEKQLLKNI